MVLETETGTFTKDSTGTDGATNVISTSFQPKAIIMWGVLQQTSDTESGGNASFSHGFSDGVNHRCVDIRLEDNVARSDYRRAQNNDGVLGFLDPGGVGFLAKASVVFNVADFTVTWDLNDTSASRIHYIIYGGSDITGVQVSDFVKDSSGTQPINQSITTDADVQNITAGQGIVFFLHCHKTAFNTEANDLFLQLGAASDTTEEALFSSAGDDNDAVGDPICANRSDKCIIGYGPATTTLQYEAEFNGFDLAGFDVNWTTNDLIADIISYMIIKGGKWEVGTETAGTVTGNKVTTTGHLPKSLLVVNNLQTATGIVENIDQSYNIGASDATTETSGAWTDNDGSATTEIGRASSITKLARILNQDTAGAPTIDGEANVASFNATDFTLDWTNAAAALYRFMWVIAGNQAETNTKTFTINAFLQQEQTFNFTIDVFTQKAFTFLFTVDTFLQKESTQTFTIDTFIQTLDQTKDFTIDSILINRNTKTFTIDVFIKALGQTFNFTIDTFVLKEFTFNFTIDSFLQKEFDQNFTIDSFLLQEQTFTFTIDSFIQQ